MKCRKEICCGEWLFLKQVVEKSYRKSWRGREKKTNLATEKRKIVLGKLLCEGEHSIQQEPTDAADGGSVYLFGFRLFILIELRKVSEEDKDGVWGVNRSFRITWAHNRCCVCVCVCMCVSVCVLLIMRLGLPLLLFVYLSSSLLSVLHSSLPPFSSPPLLHLAFSCRASLHIYKNLKQCCLQMFSFFVKLWCRWPVRAVLNSGLNTIMTLDFKFSDSLQCICSESIRPVLKLKYDFMPLALKHSSHKSFNHHDAEAEWIQRTSSALLWQYCVSALCFRNWRLSFCWATVVWNHSLLTSK